MAQSESRHFNRDERSQFYLASERGAHVHRATSDAGDGEARYDITSAADNSPIATNVSFAALQAFTSGAPLPALPEVPAPPAEAILNPLDDLTAAVAALANGFTALDQAVQVQLAAVNAALAGSGLPAATTLPMRQASANVAHITATMSRDAAKYR
jgi:hypothetical protein